MPLPYAAANILLIVDIGSLVKVGFGLEITYTKKSPPMLKAVTQDIQQPVCIAGIVESCNEFLNRVTAAGILKACPLFGL